MKIIIFILLVQVSFVLGAPLKINGFSKIIKATNSGDYFSISEDNNMLAFADDISGRRQYRTRFKNLKTGKVLPNIIENTGGDYDNS